MYSASQSGPAQVWQPPPHAMVQAKDFLDSCSALFVGCLLLYFSASGGLTGLQKHVLGEPDPFVETWPGDWQSVFSISVQIAWLLFRVLGRVVQRDAKLMTLKTVAIGAFR